MRCSGVASSSRRIVGFIYFFSEWYKDRRITPKRTPSPKNFHCVVSCGNISVNLALTTILSWLKDLTVGTLNWYNGYAVVSALDVRFSLLYLAPERLATVTFKAIPMGRLTFRSGTLAVWVEFFDFSPPKPDGIHLTVGFHAVPTQDFSKPYWRVSYCGVRQTFGSREIARPTGISVKPRPSRQFCATKLGRYVPVTRTYRCAGRQRRQWRAWGFPILPCHCPMCSHQRQVFRLSPDVCVR